jgi:beta-lactamase regulating signal transducer with metallopeptidase domain
MRAVLIVLNNPLANRVGWALLHSLWQGALIGLAFGFVIQSLRGRSANARYLVACFALGLLVLAPAVTFCFSMSEALSHGPAPPATGYTVPTAISSYSTPPPLAAADNPAPPPGGQGILSQTAPWLAGLWFTGVLVYLIRLTQSGWRVKKLQSAPHEPVDAEWLERLDHLCRRLAISRRVKLAKSALVEVPTVIGWLQPVILMPVATLAGLTTSQLEAILAHELAHVKRLDYLVNVCQCVIEALMFYHPVAWWISRCIREERENCCDDLVVQVCGDRLGYARALTTLEDARAAHSRFAFAASGGSLLQRIRRLLGNESGAANPWHLGGVALLGIGLLLITLGVATLLAPTNYKSAARVRLGDSPSANLSMNENGRSREDPFYLQTEFQVIESEIVLKPAIEKLNLNVEWGKKYGDGAPLKTSESIQLLKARMDLHAIPNTRLVDIGVYSEDREEAARLANAIAETYREHRLNANLYAVREGVKVLEERFQEQEAKIRLAQSNVIWLRIGLAISDAEANENAQGLLSSADTLRRIERTKIESRVEYDRQNSLLTQLKSLREKMGDLKMAQIIPTAVTEAQLVSLNEQLTIAEQRLLSAQKEFGPEHTEVLKANAAAEDLRSKITNRVAGIMLGLEARANSLKDGLDRLETEVASARSNEIHRAVMIRPYVEAKRQVEEMEAFRKIINMKIASENIDATLPKTSLVEIVDRAFPSARPSSSNSTQAFILIAIGLLLDLAGFFFLRIGARVSETVMQKAATAVAA